MGGTGLPPSGVKTPQFFSSAQGPLGKITLGTDSVVSDAFSANGSDSPSSAGSRQYAPMRLLRTKFVSSRKADRSGTLLFALPGDFQ